MSYSTKNKEWNRYFRGVCPLHVSPAHTCLIRFRCTCIPLLACVHALVVLAK